MSARDYIAKSLVPLCIVLSSLTKTKYVCNQFMYNT